jgi:hypothetical protein
VILTTPLLEGLDAQPDEHGKLVGKKMSKSLGNYIGINEPAHEIFGKLMSTSDALMWRYFELLSDRSAAEIAALRQGHPMDAKKALGVEITARYHSQAAALAAREGWEAQFSRREVPDDMPEIVLGLPESGGLWIAQALKDANLVPVHLRGRPPDRQRRDPPRRRSGRGPQPQALQRAVYRQGRQAPLGQALDWLVPAFFPLAFSPPPSPEACMNTVQKVQISPPTRGEGSHAQRGG